MKITIQTYCLYFAVLLMMSACNEKVDFSDRLGFEYYPLEIGNYVDYQVEKTKYSLDGEVVERYQMRELVQDTFTDSNGELVHRLEIYKRNSSNEDWVLDSVWASKRNEFQASKVQGNHTFLKLSFPIEEGKTWNGNALNGFQNDEYVMQNLGQSKEMNGQRFVETLEVIQEDDSSLVGKNKRIEYYAKDVGLIYRGLEVVTYSTDSADLGLAKILFGDTYFQTIISYGKQE